MPKPHANLIVLGHPSFLAACFSFAGTRSAAEEEECEPCSRGQTLSHLRQEFILRLFWGAGWESHTNQVCGWLNQSDFVGISGDY